MKLLEAIDPKARAKIGQVPASNLANTHPSELHAHFEGLASSQSFLASGSSRIAPQWPLLFLLPDLTDVTIVMLNSS